MIHGGSRRRRRKMAERELQTAGFLDDAYDSVAGAADHLAGSTDEAVARTFDDEEGGGVIDGTAGFFDHAAGSVDEAVGRQFDDEEGGGLLSGLASVTPGVRQSQTVRERQVEEGILEPEAALPEDARQASASVTRTDNEAPPEGTAVQIIRVGNGLSRVSNDNPNRRQTNAQDIVSAEGAVLGIGATAAGAAAAGASIGSVAPGVGTAIGAAAGITGSLIASQIEEAVGALGFTITGAIDGEDVGQTVTSVGVPAAGIGTNGKNVELQHSVPSEPGEYTLNVVVSMWQTGTVVNSMEIPITVREGVESQEATQPADGGSIAQPGQNNDPGTPDDNGGGSGSGLNIVNWASNNPGMAAVAGVGGIVAINSFTGGLGESLGE